MPESESSQAGDVRYPVSAGSSRILFDHPVDGRRCEVEVTAIGLAGLDFVNAEVLEPGTMLEGAVVEVDGALLQGDIRVGRESEDSGGLFHPANHKCREALAVVIERLKREPAPRVAMTPRYDRAFQDAVDAGTLTPNQAFSRGKREVWAANLVAKHDLTMESALAVADNRTTLVVAKREQQARKKRIDRMSESVGRSMIVWVLAVVALGALAVWWIAAGPAGGPGLQTVRGVEVRTNAAGSVVRIDGPDPRSVLAAYCESGGAGRRLESLGVTHAVDSRPELMLGILRDRAAPERRLAIYISLNRTTQRWTAGNGRAPLAAFKAPLP